MPENFGLPQVNRTYCPHLSVPMRRIRLFTLVIVMNPGVTTSATPSALIVISLSAGEGQAARLQACAQDLHTGFLAQVFCPSLAHSGIS